MMSQFAQDVAQDVIANRNPKWAEMVRQDKAGNMLLRQIQRRFGDAPTWAREKIAKADLLTLEEWSLRFVDAQSLEEIFT